MDGLDPVYEVKGRDGYYCREEFGNEKSKNVVWKTRSNGYRLPTDAEWEWAARGGRNSQGYTFAGSNNLNDVGWYSVNSGGAAHAVGEKAANELGLFDMSGNVWEWCWDLDASSCVLSQHRLRGGCWRHRADDCAVLNHSFSIPTDSSYGLRLSRSL